MHKRYFALFMFIGIAAACAAVGWFFTPPPHDKPIKLVMPNAGGRVVFTHRIHAEDLGYYSCEYCHHESEGARPNPQPCGACHGVDFNAAFVESHQKDFADDPQSCLTCHHTEIASNVWDKEMHEAHAENYTDSCQSCHHTEDIEPEPTNCADCHERIEQGKAAPVDAEPLLLRDAVHKRCASCHAHEDTFAEGLQGCATCHNLTNERALFVKSDKKSLTAEDADKFSKCATCHYEQTVETVMPSRMQAFHSQCGDCHTETGLGPSVEQEKNQCFQCHIR